MRITKIFPIIFCLAALAICLTTAAELPGDIDIRQGGSLWARIEKEGWIRIEGTLAGRFESDGTVRKNGSLIGEIEADGYIRKNGSLIGRIESDGTLRHNGSIIGQIESGGAIRLDGSLWGSAENCCPSFDSMRAVAAVLVFFTSDFFGDGYRALEFQTEANPIG